MLTFSVDKGRVQNSNTAVSPSSSDFGNKSIHAALPAGRGRERAQEKTLTGK
jgi:hypothetical protein